ncbi:hypothetical protein AVKW3434_07505 [Acidovorax sp. SUPP3434]|nr:hypothetical protein AVKW3434_07505 [Acidovorax sp. SUPP3434]
MNRPSLETPARRHALRPLTVGGLPQVIEGWLAQAP